MLLHYSEADTDNLQKKAQQLISGPGAGGSQDLQSPPPPSPNSAGTPVGFPPAAAGISPGAAAGLPPGAIPAGLMQAHGKNSSCISEKGFDVKTVQS